jgi:single-stranded DNA-binding protein
MIDALVAGKLYGRPMEKTSKTGKPFVTAKVRAAAGDGEALFVNVIAFDGSACAALLALEDGDSVALSGALTPKTWTDRDGNAKPALDLVAHAVTTAYHVTRKRKAVATVGKAAQEQGGRVPQEQVQVGGDGFDAGPPWGDTP